MKAAKVVSKIAYFTAIISIIFAIILAVSTYFLIQIANQGVTPPTQYLAFYILSTILPYLLLTAISLIVAVMCGGAGAEEQVLEPEEDLPPTEHTEQTA